MDPTSNGWCLCKRKERTSQTQRHGSTYTGKMAMGRQRKTQEWCAYTPRTPGIATTTRNQEKDTEQIRHPNFQEDSTLPTPSI